MRISTEQTVGKIAQTAAVRAKFCPIRRPPRAMIQELAVDGILGSQSPLSGLELRSLNQTQEPPVALLLG